MQVGVHLGYQNLHGLPDYEFFRRETQIAIRGASIQSGTATVLTNSDIHAHNSFEQRNAVAPQTRAMDSANSFVFPPASVTKLTLTLG